MDLILKMYTTSGFDPQDTQHQDLILKMYTTSGFDPQDDTTSDLILKIVHNIWI